MFGTLPPNEDNTLPTIGKSFNTESIKVCGNVFGLYAPAGVKVVSTNICSSFLSFISSPPKSTGTLGAPNKSNALISSDIGSITVAATAAPFKSIFGDVAENVPTALITAIPPELSCITPCVVVLNKPVSILVEVLESN